MLKKENPADFFEKVIWLATGREEKVKNFFMISGGCINMTVCVITEHKKFFLKYNEEMPEEFFLAELKGLKLLSKNKSLVIPECYGYGRIDGKSFLLMEFLEQDLPNKQFWEHLAQGLATQHKITEDYFGLDHSNYIGSLPQSNKKSKGWVEFFIKERLQKQAGLAHYNQLIDKSIMHQLDSFYQVLHDLIPECEPSLLHGDLWAGNVYSSVFGPSVIDPAVYFGHSECDIAMSYLFGGFAEEFYDTYFEIRPLEIGFSDRREIYNLYPLFVHVNLFGTSYLPAIERILKRFCP
jgi:protein-ribulosamine 3-kinase